MQQQHGGAVRVPRLAVEDVDAVDLDVAVMHDGIRGLDRCDGRRDGFRFGADGFRLRGQQSAGDRDEQSQRYQTVSE